MLRRLPPGLLLQLRPTDRKRLRRRLYRRDGRSGLGLRRRHQQRAGAHGLDQPPGAEADGEQHRDGGGEPGGFAPKLLSRRRRLAQQRRARLDQRLRQCGGVGLGRRELVDGGDQCAEPGLERGAVARREIDAGRGAKRRWRRALADVGAHQLVPLQRHRREHRHPGRRRCAGPERHDAFRVLDERADLGFAGRARRHVETQCGQSLRQPLRPRLLHGRRGNEHLSHALPRVLF